MCMENAGGEAGASRGQTRDPCILQLLGRKEELMKGGSAAQKAQVTTKLHIAVVNGGCGGG